MVYYIDRYYSGDLLMSDNILGFSEKEIKDGSKKLLAGRAVATAVFGMGLSADEFSDTEKRDPGKETRISMTESVNMTNSDIIDLGTEIEGEEEAEKHIVRSLLASVLFAPFWILSKIIPPLAAPILSNLRLVGILFLAIVAGLKLKYPDVPLKEMLSGKNAAVIGGGSFALFSLISLLPLFIPGGKGETLMSELAIVLKVTCAICIYLYVVFKKVVMKPKKVKYEAVIDGKAIKL